MNASNWYVIHVLTGSEQMICGSIKEMLEPELYQHCFVPMAERQHRVDGKFITLRKPLFPGFLFIISDRIEEVCASLYKIAKFKRILKTGNAFVSMQKEEVKAFSSLVDEAFNVTLSKGYIAGDQITITEGPLKGQEGRIRKIDRHKRMASVDLSFLGKTINVRVPLEIAEKS